MGYPLDVSVTALMTLSRQLHDAADVERVMDLVVAAVRTSTRYRRAFLNILAEDGATMEVVGYAVDDLELLKVRVPMIAVAQDPLLQRSFRTDEPIVIEDMRLDPLADQEQVKIFGNRTVITVPMVRLADRIGTLNVGTFGDEGVRPPTPAEVDFVVQVASLVSVVVGRLRAEAAARALEAKLRSAQRLEALGRLAGEVSHDFNNVLVSIVGNADLAQDMLRGHPAEELVREIQDAAARATRMTRQLLAFSRGQVLDAQAVDLGEVVEHLTGMLQPLLPAYVSLCVSVAPERPWARVDRGQLEQLVMNLVLNARDAIGERGGHITVEIGRVARPTGPAACVTVTDDGEGIPPEAKERIFEPFYTTKGPHRGTGLGLAVVDSVVKQHGGTLELDTTVGVGSRFSVLFPEVPAEVREGPAPAGRAGAPARHAHVLVADDDEAVRSLVARVLRAAGYQVTLAVDGQDALERLAAAPDVAVVVTDLMMPRLTGQALVERLRAQPKLPEVVVMTGYAPGDLRRLQEVQHLTKPFTPADLLEVVGAALRGAPS